MKNIQKLIHTITTGIDRVNFSIPIIYMDDIIKHLNRTSTFIVQYPKGNYWYQEYRFFGNRVIVCTKLPCIKTTIYNARCYLSTLNPSPETQNYLRHVFTRITNNKTTRLNGILINQVEVSFDFYTTTTKTSTNTDTDLEIIKQYADNHFIMKYSRGDSYRTIGEEGIDLRTNCIDKVTDYIGRKGNIRNGAKGVRSYIKLENGVAFYRFEMQFNRPYLKKHNITFNSLPLNPLSFQIFDHINILGNFSNKGIKNLSRSILRKKGTTQSTTPDFSKLHKNTANLIRFQVLGGSRGKTRSIPTQIAQLKTIKQKAGLSINPMQYFPVHHDIHQLICCHAAIGYTEENCSKRLLLCQME